MTSTWSQEVTLPKPLLTWSVLIAVVLFPAVVLALVVERQWTPLQRHYLLTYLFTARSGSGQYRVLAVNYPNNRKLLADDSNVNPALIAPGSSPQTAIPFVLTEAARKQGAQSLEWVYYRQIENAKLHHQLEQVIYDGQSLWDLSRRAISCGLALLFLLPFAISQDRKALHQLWEGRIRQGPVRVSRAEFNGLKSSDGIGFVTTDPPTLGERLLNRRPDRMVRIPRADERSHLLLMGDSGTGKSALIRQLLPQIRARGETAIVYDPELEFTPQFYDSAQGDLILNPVDERMSYWTPSDEVRYPPEALTLANSLFPDKPQENHFFTDAARRIFAYLVVRYQPSPEELTYWMSHFQEIDERLAGTPLAPFIATAAGGQRAAVQSTFNQAASAFHLLPREQQTNGRWSGAAWAIERKGWIFLPSRHEIRESLRPLVSLWLDALLLRLMTSAEGGARPVWVILDELASLQRLPQLPTAVTEARKANLRLVLGFQGRSQLEARYGLEAETMLSQPKTKIFLATSEPRAARWISEAIGNVEIERLKESRTEPSQGFSDSWKRRSKTYHLERRVEPLVMDSVIQGLPDLSGYLKSRDLVVAVKFPWIPPERHQPGFIPRAMEGLAPLAKPQTAVARAKGASEMVSGVKPEKRTNQEAGKGQESQQAQMDIFE